MSLEEELVQVAAVAVAILTDLRQGDTQLLDTNPDSAFLTAAHNITMTQVQMERYRQEEKWGTQHHSIAEWLVILGEEYGESCKAALEEVMYP